MALLLLNKAARQTKMEEEKMRALMKEKMKGSLSMKMKMKRVMAWVGSRNQSDRL